VIDRSFAERFGAGWIESWNSRDLNRILSHYADDFEMHSPVIAGAAGEPAGMLRGKESVGRYWAGALERYSNLHFELITTLLAVNSVTLYYRGVRGLSSEVFHFGEDGKVVRAYAYYAGESENSRS